MALSPDEASRHMDIINIAAILLSPVVAVAVTLWWQGRKEKRDAKRRLFVTLMQSRKASPPTHDWVNALNLIDVVYADCPRVVALWHELYDLFHNPARTQAQDHKQLELLSEMAKVLGFRRLQQTDIDKFYSPQAHVDQLIVNAQCQSEWLRVLRNTSQLMPLQRSGEGGGRQIGEGSAGSPRRLEGPPSS